MSRKIDKSILKRQSWIERTATALDLSEDTTIRLLGIERRQSIRLNRLRGDPKGTLSALNDIGWKGINYDWLPDGYTVDSPLTTIRDSALVNDGKVFIQNAASWLPVLALDPQPGECILDVCAAPGGKTSHIAAITYNHAIIWANDNSRLRLAKLRANMDRLGIRIEQYTLFDAAKLARKLEGQTFDKILLDAPCSGEGLMSLNNDSDFATWSVAHIKRLQQLQKRLITQSWQLLKPGGTLVYSTCTMAPEENEAAVDYILRRYDDAEIVPFEIALPNRVETVRAWNGKKFSPEICHCMRLIPSQHIEAFFVAKLKKLPL